MIYCGKWKLRNGKTLYVTPHDPPNPPSFSDPQITIGIEKARRAWDEKGNFVLGKEFDLMRGEKDGCYDSRTA